VGTCRPVRWGLLLILLAGCAATPLSVPTSVLADGAQLREGQEPEAPSPEEVEAKPPSEEPKVTPFDDATPSEDMIDPGVKQLKHMKSGVSGLLGKIKEEEEVRKRREHETAVLDEEKAEEKKASRIRQGKFEAIMKEQEDDEEKKVIASEEEKMETAEKKATESKPPSAVEKNWEIKLDQKKNEITASEIAPKPAEKQLYLDKYTESLDAEGQTKHKHLQALLHARKTSNKHCTPCKEKCKTEACNDWCTMRYCMEGADDIDVGPELASQEEITGNANEKDVNPGKDMMCSRCVDPDTEEQRAWCLDNGCLAKTGEAIEDEVAPDAASPSDA